MLQSNRPHKSSVADYLEQDGCICNVGNLNPIYHCLDQQCSRDTANDVLGEVVEVCWRSETLPTFP
jgi:hypothetical protein